MCPLRENLLQNLQSLTILNSWGIMAHKLATINERDESITNQPTMQRYDLSQYAPLAVLSATHRNSTLWGNQLFPTTLFSTHAHISKAFFLFAKWYVLPSCTSAEACVWPNAQLQMWDKCSVARNQTCVTMCVKCRCCATNLCFS